jgi:hypothetical protein
MASILHPIPASNNRTGVDASRSATDIQDRAGTPGKTSEIVDEEVRFDVPLADAIFTLPR